LSEKRHEEALAVLEDLTAQDSTFRPMEIAILTARNLRYLHRPRSGARVLKEHLARDPRATSFDDLMWEYFVCAYPNPVAPGQEQPILQWRRNRIHGVPNPIEAIDTTFGH
jgi:hypothetical protein